MCFVKNECFQHIPCERPKPKDGNEDSKRVPANDIASLLQFIRLKLNDLNTVTIMNLKDTLKIDLWLGMKHGYIGLYGLN